MATDAQTLPLSSRSLAWFWEFLKEELAPYPGRAALVARMTLAATLVMIICMTFRVSYGSQGAIYALLISRENPRATLESAGITFLVTGVTAAYILISMWFVIEVPVLHFLWLIGTFFVGFYAISTMTNYPAVVIFTLTLAAGGPLWTRHVSAETNVEDTLRVVLAGLIGVVVTAVVELAFARTKPGDNVVMPIAERLAAVESLLTRFAEGGPIDHPTEKKITGLAILGTSMLRRALRRSDYSPHYTLQMGGVAALVGRLVDIAATLTQLTLKPCSEEQKQLRMLATTVAGVRSDLMNRRIPMSIDFSLDNELARGVPLLREMEQTVALIPQALTGSLIIDEYLSASGDAPRPKFVVPDALTNPEHLAFALKGCFAASLCYIIYNSIDWPGISVAVTACLLTGLSTIGASRQKQILFFAGALVGGFLVGMGSQIFILPNLDSITGFTVFFLVVTVLASWFMTCSPRLSFFGLQVAFAFFLINLQEFGPQTSLSIGRDRVAGVLLGLFGMWLIFDQLWGAPAAVEMMQSFILNLRLLANLAREPVPGRDKSCRTDSIRETINANFDKVRSLADAVLFEFGSSRDQNLELRSRIRRWQPPLHTFLVIRLLLLKYRLQLPGFELPPAVRAAQREFDDHLANTLDGMADRLEGKAPEGKDDFEYAFEELENTVRSCCSKGPQGLIAPELRTFLALSRSLENVTSSLDNKI